MYRKRLTVELENNGDRLLVRNARIEATYRGETLRELVLRAVRTEVEKAAAQRGRDLDEAMNGMEEA